MGGGGVRGCGVWGCGANPNREPQFLFVDHSATNNSSQLWKKFSEEVRWWTVQMKIRWSGTSLTDISTVLLVRIYIYFIRSGRAIQQAKLDGLGMEPFNARNGMDCEYIKI
jgi:hypothetical protein